MVVAPRKAYSRKTTTLRFKVSGQHTFNVVLTFEADILKILMPSSPKASMVSARVSPWYWCNIAAHFYIVHKPVGAQNPDVGISALIEFWNFFFSSYYSICFHSFRVISPTLYLFSALFSFYFYFISFVTLYPPWSRKSYILNITNTFRSFVFINAALKYSFF